MDAQLENERLRAELVSKEAELTARCARVVELERQVAELTETVTELREALGRNSDNSNLPPSSDGPGKNARRKTEA